MNPKLVAIAGSHQGSVIEWTAEELSIGRDPASTLCLTDLSASRKHCLLKKDGVNFQITDLHSLNGTLLNDIPIQQRVLQHGDRIVIGDSLFLFLVDDSAAESNPSVQFDETVLPPRTTVSLRFEDAHYLHPQKLLGPSVIARAMQDLSTLMKISTAINSIRGLDALERRLMELIFEVVPAERGAILLLNQDTEKFLCVHACDRLSGLTEPFPVSRAVINQVVQEKVAILSNDIRHNELLKNAKSLENARIFSLLAVPLLLFKNAFGIIYLDASESRVHFDEVHLQLMTAIAGIAAVALENARHVEWLESENKRLQAEIKIEHNMVGESLRMREVYQFIEKVAPTESTVLIYGESGTGKELAAHAIHSSSNRSTKPFVVINCAALAETLLESELFGYEKGAFTGADAQRKGKLEVADGGTVFLDEVGELSPMLQMKLLRVLQEREFDRVGGTRPVHIDVRFIAATNKNLEESVKNGSFRQDLYYRLNVVSMRMPALRERREDLPLLATYFAAKCSKQSKRRLLGISPDARACLNHYDWPGNVRELENAIERAVVLGTGELILPEDLPETVLEAEPLPTSAKLYAAVQESKRQTILKAVQQANGNYSEAAKLLGIHPNNLHRLMRNLNLKSLLDK